MKNLTIIAIYLALTFSLLAQDKIDPDTIKNFTDTGIYNTTFQNDHFIRGWNWSNGKKISDALNISTKISFIPEH